MVYDAKESNYDHVPTQDQIPSTADRAYLHYTSNNTVAGTEYGYVPETEAPLVCDMSSDILSRPVDGSRFHCIYAGAQKNLGPAGVTVVVLHKDWVARCADDLPEMLSYRVHAAKGSRYNTPSTFGIYMVERVCAWIEDQGGLGVIEDRNIAQSALVYDAIDASPFWKPKVVGDSRSRMNVTFTTGDDALDTRFWKEAADAGMSGLKGHSSVGGLRASLYNAQTTDAVEALVSFMNDYEVQHG